MPKVGPSSRTVKHVVCSEEQIDLMLIFLENPDTDPQLAMMLSLTLFFSVSIEQFRGAKANWSGDSFSIIFEKKKTSMKARAGRPLELTLPKGTHWFESLQRRYHRHWWTCHKKLGLSGETKPLLIYDRSIDGRGLGRTWIVNKIKTATKQATGIEIPIHVLKQTSALFHKRRFDASVLQRMGWGETWALTYIWAPTIYFTPRDRE